jgi:hypothetical protein
MMRSRVDLDPNRSMLELDGGAGTWQWRARFALRHMFVDGARANVFLVRLVELSICRLLQASRAQYAARRGRKEPEEGECHA